MLNLIQSAIFHNLKDPHSKALEPDCLSLSACDYDRVSKGRGTDTAGWVNDQEGSVMDEWQLSQSREL